MLWERSNRADRSALPLAERHYNRQKPGSPQFVSPGSCLVLLTPRGDALWVSTRPKHARHAWPGAWVCTHFRNESTTLSSLLIREAIALTRGEWGDPPPQGMITFVDPDAVRRKRDPGRCFIKAGFVRLPERTKVYNRIVLHLAPERFPAPAMLTLDLFAGAL